MADSRLTLYTLTTYEIRVPGRLSTSWADYIGAEAIAYADDEPGGPSTVLTLRNADQSALIGLINALFAASVPLLSVRHVYTAGQMGAAKDTERKT